MFNRLLPLNDTDFWWLRYVLGIAVPIGLWAWGLYSIVTQNSYIYWRRVGFVPVHGEQAILIGVASIGVALAFFAYCYAQYHEKMGFYYQWLFVPGALLAIGGYWWCNWIFIAS